MNKNVEDTKKLLQEQLQLLAEKSVETESIDSLIGISDVMEKIARVILRAYPHPDARVKNHTRQ